ncbi:hypothetical protein Taro_037100 [Colocasia esculenta]|uniref:Bifunctional inhibitor/plant lipid transfer protein/seed storage helical domain-containing protein n=1 Tax=Colocasia esculenta TaxID=4460 RepID=A0A843WJS4_COLES|nr:hypothetical protein [Colocasia esculenta]
MLCSALPAQPDLGLLGLCSRSLSRLFLLWRGRRKVGPCAPAPHTGGSATPVAPHTGGSATSVAPHTLPSRTGKLSVCANVLSGLINVGIGKPLKTPCCPLLQGLVDLEAAVCLCTAIKADIHLDIPLSLSLLLNYCGKGVPKGFNGLMFIFYVQNGPSWVTQDRCLREGKEG